MGKFNWKRAIAGGSEHLRGLNEEKRAYERQDREMAQRLYADMLEKGMDVPDVSALGPMAQELAKQYKDQLPKVKQRELEAELKRIGDESYAREAGSRTAQTLFGKTEAEDPYKGIAEGPAAIMQHFNITPEEWKNLPNDVRNRRKAEYHSLARKAEAGGGSKESKPRYNVRQDPTTGAVYKFDLDTNEETLVKPETPEHKKNRETKEKTELKKETLKREDEARKVFDKFAVDPKEERLSYYNDWLKLYGKKIVKIPGESWYSKDTYDIAPLEAEQPSSAATQPQTFNDKHIQATAAKTGKSPQEVKAMLEAKGLKYVPE